MPDRTLVAFLLHQRDAPLDARERAIDGVERMVPASDHFVLASCHRVEVYALVDGAGDPRAWLAERTGDAAALFAVARDASAPRHLFRVACGLDSAVRGEGQILGQLRRTYDAARAGRALDPELSALCQAALHLARELRATTPLGTVRRSVGSLAVDEALRLLPHPSEATALVIGAGEMGKLASRALRSRVRELVVANRDAARAAALAAEIGAQAVPLAALDDALARAHVVISAADTRGALLTADRLARRLARGPLAVVDIAVPRSVDAAARALAGLAYRSVDDLASEADRALDETFALAERRCAEEAAAFLRRLRARDAGETIRRIRDRAEGVRRAQLARALARLGHLQERDRRVVESLAAAITNGLLHRPTQALREQPERAAAAEELFGLDRS